MTLERKEKVENFRLRSEKMKEKALRLEIRGEEMSKVTKTVEELRLEGEALDKMQRDRMRFILKMA